MHNVFLSIYLSAFIDVICELICIFTSLICFRVAELVKLKLISFLNPFWLSGKFRHCSLPGKNFGLFTVILGYMTSKHYLNWVENSVVGGQILGLCRLIFSLFCYDLHSKYYIVDISNLWKYFTVFEKACSNLSFLPTSFSCLMKPVDCVENWQNNFTKIGATSQFLPLTWYKIEQCLPDFFSICGKHWWNSNIKMMWA